MNWKRDGERDDRQELIPARGKGVAATKLKSEETGGDHLAQTTRLE
jgi:hypothetical protein